MDCLQKAFLRRGLVILPIKKRPQLRLILTQAFRVFAPCFASFLEGWLWFQFGASVKFMLSAVSALLVIFYLSFIPSKNSKIYNIPLCVYLKIIY